MQISIKKLPIEILLIQVLLSLFFLYLSDNLLIPSSLFCLNIIYLYTYAKFINKKNLSIFFLLINIFYLILIMYLDNYGSLNWTTPSAFATDDAVYYAQASFRDDYLYKLEFQAIFASGSTFVWYLRILNNIFSISSVNSLILLCVFLNQLLIFFINYFLQNTLKILSDYKNFQETRNLICVTTFCNPIILYYSLFALKEIFIIFQLSFIFYFLIKINLSKNKRTFLLNFIVLIISTALCISDRFSYFILVIPTSFLYLLISINKTYIKKSLFISFLLLLIIFIFLIMRINLTSISYLFSHLLEFTDFSLINVFKGFVTPSPFNFLSSSNLPNTIDQILFLALSYNLILFVYYFYLVFRSYNFETTNLKMFNFFKITFSWILINFIFFSIFNSEMLRFKLSYTFLIPLSVCMLVQSKKNLNSNILNI